MNAPCPAAPALYLPTGTRPERRTHVATLPGLLFARSWFQMFRKCVPY